jgi:threonine dehydratase
VSKQAVSRPNIEAVEKTIRPYIRRTPVITIDGSEFELDSFPLTLKLELFQHSGSFKTRGAFANLLMREVPPAGVVAASGGNHGAAVAYAAMKLGIPARIFLPETSSPAKLNRIREYGADLVVSGQLYADALQKSEEWVAESGALPVHAFDQAETLLGQGTVATEIEQQLGEVDTVLVAVGGGGLIGGIASWFGGRVRIVAVEPRAAPTLSRALEAGRPVNAEAGGIAADSLAPRRIGELVFPIAQRYVDRVLLLEDEAIRRAQATLWRVMRVVAEPGGVAAFAALVSGQYRPKKQERVVAVICGGNTVAVDFSIQ